MKRAYRRLAKQLHPDVAGDLAAARMAEVNRAYELLLGGDAPESDSDSDSTGEEATAPLVVPDGFVRFPRTGPFRLPRAAYFDTADALEGALSLSATSADLSGLDDLPPFGLWRLDLSDRPVTDAEVMRVWRFERLEQLDLSNTKVTDAGLAGVTALRRLDSIQLAGCRIGDATLAALAQLPKLAALGLAATGVTGPGLTHVSGHPTLLSIDLRATTVGSEAVEHLATIPNLRRLAVGFRGQRRLRSLRRLRPDIVFI